MTLSDDRTQLLAAERELGEMIEGWNKEKPKEFAEKKEN